MVVQSPCYASFSGTLAPDEHAGVRCDGCSGPIRGVRNKCIFCPDYDLCTQCKQNGIHNHHMMHEILPQPPPPTQHPNTPTQYPAYPQTPTQYPAYPQTPTQYPAYPQTPTQYPAYPQTPTQYPTYPQNPTQYPAYPQTPTQYPGCPHISTQYPGYPQTPTQYPAYPHAHTQYPGYPHTAQSSSQPIQSSQPPQTGSPTIQTVSQPIQSSQLPQTGPQTVQSVSQPILSSQPPQTGPQTVQTVSQPILSSQPPQSGPQTVQTVSQSIQSSQTSQTCSQPFQTFSQSIQISNSPIPHHPHHRPPGPPFPPGHHPFGPPLFPGHHPPGSPFHHGRRRHGPPFLPGHQKPAPPFQPGHNPSGSLFPSMNVNQVQSLLQQMVLTGGTHSLPAQTNTTSSGSFSSWQDLSTVKWAPAQSGVPFSRMTLQSSDPDYQAVIQNMNNCGGQAWTSKVVMISRIENYRLFSIYKSCKEDMEREHGPGFRNERTLWHGTSVDVLGNIYRGGFNRSYCGKNATAYGDGVYFATSFSYSASSTYSPPDSSGQKYIFQCRVLTGHFTPGQPGLKEPPMRTQELRYDSVVDNTGNPNMFVIFKDMQVYPEYVITLKA